MFWVGCHVVSSVVVVAKFAGAAFRMPGQHSEAVALPLEEGPLFCVRRHEVAVRSGTELGTISCCLLRHAQERGAEGAAEGGAGRLC